MAQVSLYLEDSFYHQIEQIAESEKMPISNWIIKQLRPKVVSHYSDDFAELFGSVDDPTFIRPEQQVVENRLELI